LTIGDISQKTSNELKKMMGMENQTKKDEKKELLLKRGFIKSSKGLSNMIHVIKK
jgi:hypothetical protein